MLKTSEPVLYMKSESALSLKRAERLSPLPEMGEGVGEGSTESYFSCLTLTLTLSRLAGEGMKAT